MRTEAIFPKPVFTPYTAWSDAISRSITARDASIRSRACGRQLHFRAVKNYAIELRKIEMFAVNLNWRS